jgi:hypothetical protein
MVIRTGFVNVNSKKGCGWGAGVHAVPGNDAVPGWGLSLNRQLVSPVPVWAR